MKSLLLSLIALFCFSFLFSQNVGIGTNTPTQKLDVNGNVRANSVISSTVSTSSITTTALTITGGGPIEGDFLKQSAGQVAFRKGYGALGINYIIAVRGFFPTNGGSPDNYDKTLVGEIKLFSGNFAPDGWMLCDGQFLSPSAYPALFTIIGTTYGGNGSTTFKLPDLRSAVPVHQSTVPGKTWYLGETSF
jgi:microcystin-dependent protein